MCFIFEQYFPVVESMRNFVAHNESNRSKVEIVRPVDVEEDVLKNARRKFY